MEKRRSLVGHTPSHSQLQPGSSSYQHVHFHGLTQEDCNPTMTQSFSNIFTYFETLGQILISLITALETCVDIVKISSDLKTMLVFTGVTVSVYVHTSIILQQYIHHHCPLCLNCYFKNLLILLIFWFIFSILLLVRRQMFLQMYISDIFSHITLSMSDIIWNSLVRPPRFQALITVYRPN